MVYSRSCRLMVLPVNWEVSEPLSSSGITDDSWNIANRTTMSLHRASTTLTSQYMHTIHTFKLQLVGSLTPNSQWLLKCYL